MHHALCETQKGGRNIMIDKSVALTKPAMKTEPVMISNEAEIKKLIAQKNAVSWTLTILELVLYFGSSV
jgi:hypothetical protein